MKPSITFTLAMLSCAGTAVLPAADYFVDAIHGSDTHSGLSPEAAWQSLEKVSASSFAPGDAIRLRSGQIFTGQLRLGDSGVEGAPISVTAYYDGPKPHVEGKGAFDAAVLLENTSHIVVEGIEISNTGLEPKAKRRGLLLQATDAGVVKAITFRNLLVRDVNGVISKDQGGGTGIRWEVTSKKKKTRIDGLLIENCHVLRCDRDAIKSWMEPWNDMGNLSTNVVIRGNLLEDIGGDGIVPIGTESALIERNRIYGARERFDPTIPKVSQHAGPSCGIWPWSSKNTHVRFNEVWGYDGTFDGQGFDSDFNCSGTRFEFNLSGDNAGGFFLICNWARHQDSGESIGNSGTVIQHNISFNDHVRSFVINGPVSDVRISGNIIYNTIEEELPLIIDTPWDRYAESVAVTGNLFYTTGTATVAQGTWAGDGLGGWKPEGPINRETIHFEGNAYSKIADHEEPGMQHLEAEETLDSLVGRFADDTKASEGFRQLFGFLKTSRYADRIAAAQ